MNAQPELLVSLLKPSQKQMPIIVIPENRAPFIASRSDMVKGSWKFDAKGSCHDRFLSSQPNHVNIQELTPSGPIRPRKAGCNS